MTDLSYPNKGNMINDKLTAVIKIAGISVTQ